MTEYRNPAETKKPDLAFKKDSLVENPEKQEALLGFITQSFSCDPRSVEELKCSVLIASDNSSSTPNADRWFIKGVFALLGFLSRGEKEAWNGESVQ